MLLEKRGELSIGVSDFSDDKSLNRILSNPDEVDAVMREGWGGLSKSRFSLRRFLCEMKRGDYVLVPSAYAFSVYEIVGDKPFSNESLTESLIEFGEIKNETEQTVYYSGDAEIGVVITIHAIGNVRNITIYNTGTREVMRIDTDKLEQLTGSGMVAGDEIIISTIKGDKSITLLNSSSRFSPVYSILK